jgi:hypothetical protein
MNVYRTPASGVFRRKSFSFAVCGNNRASVSRFVAGIRLASGSTAQRIPTRGPLRLVQSSAGHVLSMMRAPLRCATVCRCGCALYPSAVDAASVEFRDRWVSLEEGSLRTVTPICTRRAEQAWRPMARNQARGARRSDREWRDCDASRCGRARSSPVVRQAASAPICRGAGRREESTRPAGPAQSGRSH